MLYVLSVMPYERDDRPAHKAMRSDRLAIVSPSALALAAQSFLQRRCFRPPECYILFHFLSGRAAPFVERCAVVMSLLYRAKGQSI
jgi:hypothetical protein